MSFFGSFHHKSFLVETLFALVDPTFSFLDNALRLLSIFYEGSFLLLSENRRLHIFFTLIFEIPDQDTFRTNSP